ncbi:MAG: hypothetical protein ACTSUE_24755 [Promethearchaeota archaeon]
MENGYHYFIKVWYDGGPFSGSQIQPNLLTVDGTIIKALKDLEYIDRTPHNDVFKVAGRTDKGVSARGAVYYVKTRRELHPCEVNHRFLTQGHPVLLWSVASLDGFVNPRNATSRTYKYFHVDAKKELILEELVAGLAALEGHHDFRYFSKAGIKPGIPTTRFLDAATTSREGDVYVFSFTSKGFLWEQVRRMVGFLLDNAGPDLKSRVKALFSGNTRPHVEPAPASALILWDVSYGDRVKWENKEGCEQQFTRFVTSMYAATKSRSKQLEAMLQAFDAREPRN